MSQDNIFSDLKVVDFSSFVAGPSAAVILGDFGADVVKVEPPGGDPWRHGHDVPPQPAADVPYQWHLANRNKRSLALDLKSPAARPVLEALVKWADVLVVNTPHPARKRLGLEYDDLKAWNPRLIYADLTGFGEKGPDADLPGFDITSYWARSGLLSMTRDAGAPPTWPVGGSGDNATAVGLYAAIVTALYRRQGTGEGSYVTTSLLAEGVWSASVSIQAALGGGRFYEHDRAHPANAALNVYRTADGVWFVLVVAPEKFVAVVNAIGRPDLLTDPRFNSPAKLMANMTELTAIFDGIFAAQPMAHWHDVFSGLHVTFGAVRGPKEVIEDPQLAANDIVVPLEGAGAELTRTISSPIQVHGVAKTPARRGPDLGEHTDEILHELGFDPIIIADLHDSGALAAKTPRAASPPAKGKTMALTKAAAASSRTATTGRLFLLDLSGQIYTMGADGSDRTTLVRNVVHPDGIAVDTAAGHIYWTSMGIPDLDDGSIERADLNGGERRVIVPPGVTRTPKQLHLDKAGSKLYWCDREGMRVMRANLDGSQVETLVVAGDPAVDRGDQTRWCVGVTLDPERGHIYWTQKGPDNAGLGRIFRAGIEIPTGETSMNRSDIEVLFDGLPEPIDLEFDPKDRRLYWTDRGDPPRGNTVNRAAVDRQTAEPEILFTHLMEGIGLTLDLNGARMFVTDLAGSVYAADLDGGHARPVLVAQGNLSGIAYAELPPRASEVGDD